MRSVQVSSFILNIFQAYALNAQKLKEHFLLCLSERFKHFGKRPEAMSAWFDSIEKIIILTNILNAQNTKSVVINQQCCTLCMTYSIMK